MTALLLDRPAAARFLRSLYDLRVSAGSLATMATRGGGPRMIKIGRYVRYRQGDLIEWVRSRSSGPLDSTSTPLGNDLNDIFEFQEDLGDLPDEPNYRNTGDPEFDEITRLLEEEIGYGGMVPEPYIYQ